MTTDPLTWGGAWSASSFSAWTVVPHDSDLWVATTDVDAGDEPGVSSDWQLMIDGAVELQRELVGQIFPRGSSLSFASGERGLPGPSGISFKGAWVAPSTYAQGDVVTYAGTAWIASAAIAAGKIPGQPDTVSTPGSAPAWPANASPTPTADVQFLDLGVHNGTLTADDGRMEWLDARDTPHDALVLDLPAGFRGSVNIDATVPTSVQVLDQYPDGGGAYNPATQGLAYRSGGGGTSSAGAPVTFNLNTDVARRIWIALDTASAPGSYTVTTTHDSGPDLIAHAGGTTTVPSPWLVLVPKGEKGDSGDAGSGGGTAVEDQEYPWQYLDLNEANVTADSEDPPRAKIDAAGIVHLTGRLSVITARTGVTTLTDLMDSVLAPLSDEMLLAVNETTKAVAFLGAYEGYLGWLSAVAADNVLRLGGISYASGAGPVGRQITAITVNPAFFSVVDDPPRAWVNADGVVRVRGTFTATQASGAEHQVMTVSAPGIGRTMQQSNRPSRVTSLVGGAQEAVPAIFTVVSPDQLAVAIGAPGFPVGQAYRLDLRAFAIPAP
jgi:hypothetical protein